MTPNLRRDRTHCGVAKERSILVKRLSHTSRRESADQHSQIYLRGVIRRNQIPERHRIGFGESSMTDWGAVSGPAIAANEGVFPSGLRIENFRS